MEIDPVQSKLLDMIVGENKTSKTYLADYIKILARYTKEKEQLEV